MARSPRASGPGDTLPSLPIAPPQPWHTLTAEEAGAVLDTGPDGLSPAEAHRRLERFGPNEIAAERVEPWWRILLHQFQDPLIYILLFAAAVTLALRDFTDTGVILVVVALNAVIGFIQELRAREAIRGLARMSAPRAEVIRDGRQQEIESRDLVPGDVVVLTSGGRVPADLRLLRVTDLEIDESALTGESVPVRKSLDALDSESLVPGDQTNMGFAGTIVTRGRGRGLVARTGTATEIGRIATAVREVGATATPLQEKTDQLGRWVGIAVLAASVVTLVVGLVQGLSAGEILLTAVALAVAAIPEGLPVVLTITLANGVSQMARRNAVIRSLPAVETLGSTTVIGSDKTGTLTRNEMTVRSVWAGGERFDVSGTGYTPEGEFTRVDPRASNDAESASATTPAGATTSAGAIAPSAALRRTLLVGVLANEADAASVASAAPIGDPTEVALLVAAAKARIEPVRVRGELAELDLLPFEPELRFMATLNAVGDGERAIHLKGAPETVLARCDRQLGPDGEPVALDEDAVRAAARRMAEDGLRVLAMAYRPTSADRIEETDLGGGFVLAGLQGMDDPVRPEAIDAVAAAHAAGIRVLMLTGDHIDTARAVGRRLGLGRPGDSGTVAAIEGHELANTTDEELDIALDEVEVYARVAPEHKLRIVERLKTKAHIVAVTGDGVNDAPALRAAHLGIAMGRTGTDVAREASDMVLADDNFATITAAVEEGRIVFSNIRKVAFFLLSTGIAMPIAILAALIGGYPLLFVPAQILWINLVTNGLQDVALAFEPGEPGLLRRSPRRHGEGIVTRRIFERLIAVGILVAAGTFAVYTWTLSTTGDVDLARSVAMTQMVVFQFFHVFNSRSLDRSIFQVPLLSNRFLFASIVLALLAQIAVLYVPFLQAIFRTAPLDTSHWGMVVLVGVTVIIGGEIDKWRNRRRGTSLG